MFSSVPRGFSRPDGHGDPVSTSARRRFWSAEFTKSQLMKVQDPRAVKQVSKQLTSQRLTTGVRDQTGNYVRIHVGVWTAILDIAFLVQVNLPRNPD